MKKKNKKKICIISTSRSDYDLLKHFIKLSFKSSKLSQNFEKGIAAAIKRAKDISVEF